MLNFASDLVLVHERLWDTGLSMLRWCRESIVYSILLHPSSVITFDYDLLHRIEHCNACILSPDVGGHRARPLGHLEQLIKVMQFFPEHPDGDSLGMGMSGTASMSRILLNRVSAPWSKFQ